MDKVAVVVLNWNGSAMLRQFLPAVVRWSAGPGVTVWVADNASTDDSCRVVREEFPAVRLLELEQNYGFAGGYNQALRRVEAEYVVLLNSDVEVTEGWLTPQVAFLDSHPDYAACQPKLRSYRRKEAFEYAGAAGGFIDRYGYPYCRGRIFGTVEEDRGQYDGPADLFWATGAALMIRLEEYRSAGGLDGRFFAHMEEIDLCWRLRSRGRRIACIPQSLVYHVGGATLKKENPRKTFLNFRNNLLMLYKNLPGAELAPVMRMRSLLDLLAALQFLLKADWGNARAVWQARQAFRRMRPDFRSDRERNLRLTRSPSVTGRSGFSVLWQYYVRGRKRFSQLPTR